MNLKVIGMDPGLANFGIVSAEYGAGGELAFTRVATMETTPCKDLSKGEDLIDRCWDLGRSINWWVTVHPYTVCVEAFSRPPNATSAIMLGSAHGVVGSLLSLWWPEELFVSSPQDIRKAVMHQEKVPKEEAVHEFLLENYPELKKFYDKDTKDRSRHWLDAAASVVAWKETA